MALILEAALGTVMSDLLKAVIAVAKQTAAFKANLETVKNRLELVKTIFDKIEERSRLLNRPQEETYEFIDQLRRGVDLVDKCSSVLFWSRSCYSKKLVELDKSIEKFFDIQVQGFVAVNTLSNGVGIQEINHKFDFMFEFLNINYKSLNPKTSLNKQHQHLYFETCASSCSSTVPVLPDGVFWVDKPLQDLKEMRARDMEPLNMTSALGTSIGELLKVLAGVSRQTLNFKSNIDVLRGTLESVKLDTINIVLDRSQETSQLLLQIRHGVNVVHKFTTINHWNLYKKYYYSIKLVKLEKSIIKFLDNEVQGFAAVNTLRNGVGTKKRYDKFKLTSYIVQNQYGSSGVNGSSLSGFGSWASVRGLQYGVPRFDEQLKDLKGMLLHNKEPVTVISGPERCGKTILAEKLCQDPEIQRIFGKNILFVTVESANITVIVKKILKRQLPDFQNNDDAIKHLEYFLKLIGPSPILLVLDDVWLNMESLLENLTFTLPNYKILVTSRFCSPRFSNVFNLKSVDYQHSIPLSSQSALPEDGSSKITEDLAEKSLYGDPAVLWSRDGKSIYVKKESKTIQRNKPELKVRSIRASQIRKDLPGVVIGEPSSQVIPCQASQCDSTSTEGGKGKERVLYEPEKKGFVPKWGNYYLDQDECRRLFDNEVFAPTPGPVQRPPTNGSSTASKQWNSPVRKGLPGVVIREPSSHVIPSQAFQSGATS